MLCEHCNLNPATVHFKSVINGVVQEKHLCQNCAEKTGQLKIFNLSNPLGSFFETLLGSMELKPTLMSSKCKACNITFEEFRQSGQLGCPTCYREFREELRPILKRIQGDIIHKGKVPKRAGGKLGIQRKLENLREELKNLVSLEEYEKAAKVRDKIRELEKEAGGESGE